MIDINELRRLAQAATPGPWYVGTGTYEGRNIYSVVSVTDAEGFTYQPVVATAEDNEVPQWDANVRLIAACNPVAISELLDRLEAAEKERDNANAAAVNIALEAERLQCENDALRSELKEVRYGVAVAHDTIKAQRAKIEAMEQQEPVWFIDERGEPKRYHKSKADYCKYGGLDLLYALPGAQTQPAPSVPTALLVAVANLVAQMEIVSRVGFVDTPDDKDSCAAFCVAEGTWLELVSAVESLASALEAAPEAKP